MNHKIRYAPLPDPCRECMNQAVEDAAANPDQSLVTVYCGHENVLITAQMGETSEGERVIAVWGFNGPVTAEQALVAIQKAAGENGAHVVSNRGGASVN